MVRRHGVFLLNDVNVCSWSMKVITYFDYVATAVIAVVDDTHQKDHSDVAMTVNNVVDIAVWHNSSSETDNNRQQQCCYYYQFLFHVPILVQKFSQYI